MISIIFFILAIFFTYLSAVLEGTYRNGDIDFSDYSGVPQYILGILSGFFGLGGVYFLLN